MFEQEIAGRSRATEYKWIELTDGTIRSITANAQKIARVNSQRSANLSQLAILSSQGVDDPDIELKWDARNLDSPASQSDIGNQV